MSQTPISVIKPPRVCRDPKEVPKVPAAFYEIFEQIQLTLDIYVTVQHLMMRESRVRDQMIQYSHTSNDQTNYSTNSIKFEYYKRERNVNSYISKIAALMEQLRLVATDAF